ncbi:hypothetical protein SAMN04488109_1841 [Chryseolinea serpens]|uniref:Uncharacterized protein n=1 Tax=Chryseolinea serpens TaxID=947013 RepID=A0A1M5MNW9_9BACT|nr:hypothetical protein SAMN04488109_1841 [Chryseolinea serpens]
MAENKLMPKPRCQGYPLRHNFAAAFHTMIGLPLQKVKYI